ncbi:MAG: AIM24 family protein [Thermoplasmata archaeon]
MEMKASGNLVPSLLVSLGQGESIVAEGGVIVHRDSTVMTEYTTLSNLTGGFTKAVPRLLFGGMPYYLLNFVGPGNLTLSRFNVGEIRIVQLKEGEVLDIAEHSILCAEATVGYDYFYVHGTERIGRMFGFFMDRITGPGMVAYHGHGKILSFDVKENETFSADYGAILSKDPNIQLDAYNVHMGDGPLGTILSFEALRISGHGRLELQTMAAPKGQNK